MEYVSEENQLLLGADSGNILTHDITHYIHFEEQDWPMLEDGDAEEDEDYAYQQEEDDPHAESRNINAELDKLLKQQQSILKQDRNR